MKKTYNTLRIKAVFLDVFFLFIFWLIIFILSVFLFDEDTEYIYRYNIRMAIVSTLFLCKDIIGGQSIGKRIFKLKVVGPARKDLSSMKLIVRNLFVFIAPIELFMLIYNNRRIGDIVTVSKVVCVNKTDKIKISQIFQSFFVLIFVFVFYLSLAYVTLFLLEKIWGNVSN